MLAYVCMNSIKLFILIHVSSVAFLARSIRYAVVHANRKTETSTKFPAAADPYFSTGLISTDRTSNSGRCVQVTFVVNETLIAAIIA